MFIRYRKIENGKTRVQIVETYRFGNNVRQKVLRHVGTAKNDEELVHIRKLAEYLKETIENELRPKLFSKEELPEKTVINRLEYRQSQIPMLVNISNLREENRITVGFHEIYGKLFDTVGYGNLLSGKISKKIFKDVVMARLAKPISKRSSCEMLCRKFGKEHSLEQIYRMMDAIKSERKNAAKVVIKKDKIPELQNITFQYSKRLLQGKITLFFYDCTTLYFESFTEDELRRFGYSKDHKFNQGQVVLALMVTQEGLPVGYDVFPGNMYEGNTLSIAINKLKEKYAISEAIIVADSGLLSQENINIIKESGYQYILGARLKSLSKNWQKKITENTEYEVYTVYYKDEQRKDKEKDVLKLKDFDYHNINDEKTDINCQDGQANEKVKFVNPERLIVSYSSARAAKDKYDREKALEKLLSKLKKSSKPSDLISNYGYKKFLKIEGESSVTVNEEKTAQEAIWDGLSGVFTNTKRSEINAYAVYSHYHGLWQVEDSFRIDKHDLRMRPVFHWTPDRIKVHIAICFVAFSLIKFLQHLLKRETGKNYSARRISIELDTVQQSILYDINNRTNKYVIPSKSSEDVLKIYDAMKLQRKDVPYKILE
jgi:transposase